MLVVKLEVWPMGDESAAREIGRAEIVNIGGDTFEGDYTYEIQLENAPPEKGLALNFARRRGPWELVHFVLADALELPKTSERANREDPVVANRGSRPAEAPMTSVVDTEHQDGVVCPVCGDETDGEEPFEDRELEDDDAVMAHCRKGCGPFFVTRHVTVTYSTRRP